MGSGIYIPLSSLCEDDSSSLCLHGNTFRVSGEHFVNGAPGAMSPVEMGGASTDSGVFTFFDGEIWEVLVRVLDGCEINGHYWVLIASATDLAHRVLVDFGDTETPYTIDEGMGPALIDTKALSCRAF